MTGFGRTGSLWAFQQAGIAPDLVCLAKGITGGVLPLAATLASPRIVEAFDTADRARTFFHGHSFTANPIACAAAVANWKLMQSGEWQTDVQRIEAFWEAQVRPLEKLPRVNEVRIRGLIAAIELDYPGGYLAEAAAAMRRTALDAGVLLRPLGNVLYAMPPLCTSDASLAQIAAALRRAAIVNSLAILFVQVKCPRREPRYRNCPSEYLAGRRGPAGQSQFARDGLPASAFRRES